MRSGLLSTSCFGTFCEDSTEPSAKTVQLGKVQELSFCRLTLNRERLYLLDSAGQLSCLNLRDKSVSALPSCKLQSFLPESNSWAMQSTARYR
jgi:hypothetical protein